MLTTVGTTAFTTGAKPARLGATLASVNLNVAGGFACEPFCACATPRPPNTNPNVTTTAAATRPRPNASLLIAPPKNEFQRLGTGRSLRFQPGLWSQFIGRKDAKKVSGARCPTE